MHFSPCVLVVAASQQQLFQAPVQPDLASFVGVEVNPAVYGAAAAPFDGMYIAPEYATEESSAGFLVPALVVAGLAIAGYSLGRASSRAAEAAPVEEEDPFSALELAGGFPADVAMLGLQGRDSSRREALAKAGGAALASLAAVQSASAKAGQFSKIEVFSLVGPPSISSPFQAGGKVGGYAGENATFGFAKSDGAILAKGYTEDVTRETAALEVSKKIVRSQLPNIESKTWWLVRSNFRTQAYNMKSNMRAIIKVQSDPAKAQKAYNTFWNEVNSLDLACVKKELDLATKEYQDVLDALTAWENVV
jgi:hypothetical protein